MGVKKFISVAEDLDVHAKESGIGGSAGILDCRRQPRHAVEIRASLIRCQV
jgi:hypothetical protein